MFRSINFRTAFRSSLIAAILYSIAVFIYLKNTNYSSTWLIYAGSFLFFLVIIVHTIFFNKVKGEGATTATRIFSSFVVTMMGGIIACIISFILLIVMVPDYLGKGPAGKESANTPANEVFDKTNGLSFRIFMGASLMNITFGSFVSILYPFSIRKDPEKDEGEPLSVKHDEPE